MHHSATFGRVGRPEFERRLIRCQILKSTLPAAHSQKQPPVVVYKTVAGSDVERLGLSPEEAFALSRVDELKTAEAIAASTGLSEKRVQKYLTRLEHLGAIEAQDESLALDASLSISLDIQRRILQMSLKLDRMTHFEVLGLHSSADRAAVKRAYFSEIGTFHPDTYFKKNLGDFTKRMEKIFQRMTEAHEVLSNDSARKQYEDYLVAVGRTEPQSQRQGAHCSELDELERLLREAESQSSPANKRESGGPKAARPAGKGPPTLPRLAVPPPLPQPPRGNVKPGRPIRPTSPALRRKALARKLGAAPPPPKPAPPVEPPRRDSMQRTAALRQLRERYEHRKGAIEDQRILKYITAAEYALTNGSPVSALNAVRIAQGVGGGSREVAARLDELETDASKALSETYLERGRYEESNGRYEEAARSFARSAKGRPSSDVLKSAAECYLKAGTELRRACELAREAVGIAPDRTDLRVTLAKVYDAAGMQTSAIKELERALQLSPDSSQVQQWLKRIKRGGV